MATPEIHVLAPRGGESIKSRKKDAAASGDGKRLKRQRVGVRRGKNEQDGDGGESERPVVKRDLLSTNTQSFRHLFSFGTDQGGGAGIAKAVSDGGETRENGARTELSKLPYVEPAVRFSIFDEEEVVAETAVDDPPAVAGLHAADQQYVQVENLPFTMPAKEEAVVHDGLAQDSPANVRAMALEFNGSGVSVAELQSEWLDGGKKDELRQDLRLKRYKRMRGRVLERSTSKDGSRHKSVNEQRDLF